MLILFLFSSILVLGISDGVNPRELEAIASAPTDQNVINIRRFTELPNSIDGISAALCNSKLRESLQGQKLNHDEF